MRKYVLFLLFYFLGAYNLVTAQLPKLNQKEIKQGYILLFDGKSTTGWKKSNGENFPSTGWKIENGIITVDPSSGKGSDIVTDKEFSDFELNLEFRLTEGANSGIKYFVFKNTSLGCEYQVLDDKKHPDAKLGINGNRLQGGLYDLIAPAKNKKDKPVGKWNKAKIIAKGTHVEHWLNGKKTVEFERGSKEFRELVSQSKFKENTGFGEIEKAPILLQYHHDIVSYRNIKIRKL